MKGPALWKISVTISPESEEAVFELLQTLFGQTCSVYTDARSHRMTVSAYLTGRWSASKCARLIEGLRKIRRCGLHVGGRKISRIRREDWAESWKRHFQPITIGSLLIRPSWNPRRPKKGQAVVTLDPGLSFGTGQHPTTRFCLEQLVRHRHRDQRQSFLDMGTGSGILAIAAAKIGYRPVEGFDLDRTALRIARANARRNRVARQVRLTCQDVSRLPLVVNGQYDVICANLVADLLRAEKRRILRRLKPYGILVLAGITRAEFDAVRRAYEKCDLKIIARTADGEWESAAFIANHG